MPTIALKNRQVRLVTPLGPDTTFLLRAEIAEEFSTLTDFDIQFLSPDPDLDIAKIVGRKLTLEIDLDGGAVRRWHAFCIECVYEGLYEGFSLFRAELRPWLWFLTRKQECRIFQNKTTIDILKQIFGDAGFTDYKFDTRETYQPREYTIQFRESDFDFASRLMEEDGLFYFFTHDATKETLVVIDDVQATSPLPDAATIDFYFRDADFRRRKDHVFEWFGGESVQTGKVTLNDYNFTKPTADLKSPVAIPKGTHSYKNFEIYDYPGDFLETADGKRLARIRQESIACQQQSARGVGNVRALAVGGTFTMAKHPRAANNIEYVVTRARHFLQIETDYDPEGQTGSRLKTLQDDDDIADTYRAEFAVRPKAEPYRAPQVTPKPEMFGVYPAVVVGKSGEEIQTDEYGRVKVWFPWDRVGAKDDTGCACWARVALPWTGAQWGMQYVPRIGQEVVVQFEHGNPDYPVVTGMRYNATNKPPYTPQSTATQTGIKTNSSKGGGGFHELVFEDLKDSEFVRFQSEKDYKVTVKNNATFSYGFEKADPGDFSEKIKNHMTTLIESGDHTFTVKTGKEDYSVKQDRTLKVEGNENVTVSKNKTDKITQDYTIDVGPNLTIKAKSKIVIECGGSKIEMTPQGIKITAMNIEQKGNMNFKAEGGMNMALKGGMGLKAEGGMQMELKGGMMFKAEGGLMTEVKGGIMTTLKGTIMMIG